MVAMRATYSQPVAEAVVFSNDSSSSAGAAEATVWELDAPVVPAGARHTARWPALDAAESKGDAARRSYSSSVRSWASTRERIRETCIWVTPISSAICDWVCCLKNRR